MSSYDKTDLEKWRTGLYAANPQQCEDLVEQIDQLRYDLRNVIGICRRACSCKVCAECDDIQEMEERYARYFDV